MYLAKIYQRFHLAAKLATFWLLFDVISRPSTSEIWQPWRRSAKEKASVNLEKVFASYQERQENAEAQLTLISSVLVGNKVFGGEYFSLLAKLYSATPEPLECI